MAGVICTLVLLLALGCQADITFTEIPLSTYTQADATFAKILPYLANVGLELSQDKMKLENLIGEIENFTETEVASEGQCGRVLSSFDDLLESVMEEKSRTSRQFSLGFADIMERMSSEKDKLENQLSQFREILSTVYTPSLPTPQAQVSEMPQDCMQAKNMGKKTGVTKIYLVGAEKEVYCDQDTDGGGWLAIIKRQKQEDGQLSFRKNMRSYESGFGNPEEEYWLGLKTLHDITYDTQQELLVKMATKTESAESYYGKFSVSDARRNYRLDMGEYDAAKSTGGDSLSYHNLMEFSTYESDNDKASGGSCSEWSGGGGWWFNYCYMTNPTGVYGGEKSFLEASDSYLEWREWQGYHTYLYSFAMFIRPAE